MPVMFPPFSGHGPCPKCGHRLLALWHERTLTNWVPPTWPVERCPCHEVSGWPQVEGGAVDPEDPADEEHIHRVCDSCGYQAIEAVAEPQQTRHKHYAVVYGIKDINARAAEGWRVVGFTMPGAGEIALMESP